MIRLVRNSLFRSGLFLISDNVLLIMKYKLKFLSSYKKCQIKNGTLSK